MRYCLRRSSNKYRFDEIKKEKHKRAPLLMKSSALIAKLLTPLYYRRQIRNTMQ